MKNFKAKYCKTYAIVFPCHRLDDAKFSKF
jgi:hypothetical protein